MAGDEYRALVRYSFSAKGEGATGLVARTQELSSRLVKCNLLDSYHI
jgi:hypothetical protein